MARGQGQLALLPHMVPPHVQVLQLRVGAHHLAACGGDETARQAVGREELSACSALHAHSIGLRLLSHHEGPTDNHPPQGACQHHSRICKTQLGCARASHRTATPSSPRLLRLRPRLPGFCYSQKPRPRPGSWPGSERTVSACREAQVSYRWRH